LEGIQNQTNENFGAQGQPPYYPPQQQYQQSPYQPPYQPPGYGPQPPPGMPPGAPMIPRQQTAKPLVAGILLIIVAIEAFAYGGILASGAEIVGAMSDVPGAEEVSTLLLICGIIFIVFGILAIVGGISSITRKSWALALIGSILGLFTIGFYFTGSILSIISLILIAISKNEFQ
jgi:hypothetical protein